MQQRQQHSACSPSCSSGVLRTQPAGQQQIRSVFLRHRQQAGQVHQHQRQHPPRHRQQWQCSAAEGEGDPEVTEQEAAEIAAAFKKMMEDGIGDELPEMPEEAEVGSLEVLHQEMVVFLNAALRT
jgi:hypothetical protein